MKQKVKDLINVLSPIESFSVETHRVLETNLLLRRSTVTFFVLISLTMLFHSHPLNSDLSSVHRKTFS